MDTWELVQSSDLEGDEARGFTASCFEKYAGCSVSKGDYSAKAACCIGTRNINSYVTVY